MPAPPKPDETKEEFMSRCMSYMSKEGNKPKDQQAAICLSMWKRSAKASKKSEKKWQNKKSR